MKYTEISDDRLMDLLIKTTQGMIWQCPKCLGILGKEMTPQLRALFGILEGFNKCSACGTSYLASEVYGGRFDVSISGLLQIHDNDFIEKGTSLLISHFAKTDDKSRRTEVTSALRKIAGCTAIDASVAASINRAITSPSAKETSLDCAGHIEHAVDTPGSGYVVKTIGDYLRLVGMQVSLGTTHDEFYDGEVVDLSDSGMHVILREVTHHRKEGPSLKYEKKHIPFADIDWIDVKDRHGRLP